jgi:hypothetical protein
MDSYNMSRFSQQMHPSELAHHHQQSGRPSHMVGGSSPDSFGEYGNPDLPPGAMNGVSCEYFSLLILLLRDEI